ncbi:polysaccharide biosynthesis/export family protein [Sulfitobacter aestuarii]|uniref:Polysaccharide biosynthesis/export family protein n=1 Tax=Sulfitobacter aestuarii TaxID=2161676 RepID=A0ABW5U3R9_9RHOB
MLQFAALLAFACVVSVSAAFAQELAQEDDPGQSGDVAQYLLGVSDRIAIRMLAWDAATLTFRSLTEIEGEYTVTAEGKLQLPLVGALKAAGSTPDALAATITERMQQIFGFNEAPSTTVEVRTYRPVYVMGDVQRPSAYEYRPGLRADQALAMAGGVFRSESGERGLMRAQIRDAGQLRELQIERVQLAVQAARLEAETTQAESVDFPERMSHPEGETALAQIYERERRVFDSRKESLRRGLASLDKSEALLATETAALEEKLQGLARQIEMMTTQTGNMEQLLERGLARSPTLISLQSSLIDLQARETDTETALFRARQQVMDIERSRIDLEARRQEEALTQLQRVKSDLAQIDARLTMLIALQNEGDAEIAAMAQDLELRPVFRVTREDGSSFLAERTMVLQPLDVLEVELIAVPSDLPGQ